MKNTLAYLELTKPKVTLLNLFVGITSFAIAQFPKINWFALAAFFIIGYVTAGGSGALNCYFDRDLDKLMNRTSRRCIPSGKVTPTVALLYGLVLTIVGLTATYLIFGMLPFIMISLGIFFYLFVYTLWLKRRSRWNVVIGAFTGSFAAFSGWTATGAALTLTPLLIGLLDFLWTPGHLWGLAMRMKDDYKRAHVPMLPVASGMAKASEFVFYFNAATFGFSFLLPILGLAGFAFLIVATIGGIKLLVESAKLRDSPSEEQAFKVFLVSMPYLASVMVALMIDKALFLVPAAFGLHFL